MSAHIARKHNFVHDSHVGVTIDPQQSGDDTTLLPRQHRTGVSGVELGARARASKFLPVLVGLDVRSWESSLLTKT